MCPQVALLSDLREQALVQEEAVLHALVGRWRAAFSWDDSGGALTVRPAGLSDTAAGLRRLDRLQRHLRRLTDELVERLVAPLVAGARLRRLGDADTLTLSVTPPDDAEPQPAAVYGQLAQLVTALHEVGALAGPLMGEFGALVGPALAKLLVAGPLSAAIPAGPDQRAAFDAVIESTERFSATLAELGERSPREPDPPGAELRRREYVDSHLGGHVFLILAWFAGLALSSRFPAKIINIPTFRVCPPYQRHRV